MAQTKDRFLQTGTGAVARTIDSVLTETVSVKDFGASPSYSASVNNIAVQAALNSGAKIVTLGEGIIPLSTTITIPADVSLEQGSLTVSGNTTIFNLSQGSKVKNINFTGTGKASGNTLELPVRISGVGLCEVSGNSFNAIGGTAVLVRQFYSSYEGSLILGNDITDCNIGINLEERGEYVNVSNNSINNNTTGIIIQGGNNRVVNNTITGNTVGVWVTAGANDAHGNVDSNSINHNPTNILIEAINVEEMSFSGNSIYIGKITLNGCAGVTFTGGLIESSVLIEEKGATECEFISVKFPGGINNTPNDGTASKVFYNNCTIDRSIAITTSTSINGSYSEVDVVSATTTVAAGATTTSIYTRSVTNAITANAAFTVEQLYDTVNFLWNPTTAIVERGFTVNISATLSVTHTTTSYSASDIDAYIVDADNNSIIYGIFSKSHEIIVDTSKTLRTLSFSGEIPRKKFQVLFRNDTALTLTIQNDLDDRKCQLIVTGW